MRACAIFPILPGVTGWSFCSQLLPIFVISPSYGTYAISCDSVTANFLARLRVLLHSPALWGAHRLQFSRATASNIRHFVQLEYLCDFARSQEDNRLPRVSLRKFPGPPKSAPVGIFARDHFSSSSFGLIRVLVRFRAIL